MKRTFFVLLQLLFQLSTGEQEYYVGGLKNKHDASGSPSTTTLLIGTRKGSTSVTVDTIDQTLYSVSLNDQQESVQLDLPVDIVVLNESYSQRNKGVRIHSTSDIWVVVLSQSGNSSDAYQLHEPANHNQLGNYVYYALTPGTGRNEARLYYSQILLVVREKDTSFTIKPTQDIIISNDLQDTSDTQTQLIEAGSSYTGKLDNYQTLLIQSPFDLTQTRIISDKPITVITGHECASFQNDSSSCSFIAEQIPPTIDWGLHFILSPFSQLDGNSGHIILNSDEEQDAEVMLSCNDGSMEKFKIERGSSFCTSSDSVFCTLQSDSPLLVALIINGSHPLMSLVPPVLAFQTIELGFTSFSCTTKTYVMLMLDSFNASSNTVDGGMQSISGFNISSDAIHISGSNSVLYLTFDNEASNYTNKINSSGAVIYSKNDNGSSCHFAYTPNWSHAISASILTFASPSYTVSENEGSVEIGINRTLDLSTITVASINISTTNGSESYSLSDEEVTFGVGEAYKTVIINITDNQWVEPSRWLIVTLSSPSKRLSPFSRTMITITDDDSVSVGLISMTYQSKSNLISIESGITRGLLGPDSQVSLVLRLQNRILVGNLSLSREVVRRVVKVDLSVFDLCSNDESTCLIISDIRFLTPPILINASLGVMWLYGSLNNITEDGGEGGRCDFIIGEFTRQSLIIAVPTIAVLLIATIVSVIFGIFGCVMSYRIRRKWTLGGGLNKLYFQDDAMSLATNDPESYELMNRLGERKTATLAINDDNEYVR